MVTTVLQPHSGRYLAMYSNVSNRQRKPLVFLPSQLALLPTAVNMSDQYSHWHRQGAYSIRTPIVLYALRLLRYVSSKQVGLVVASSASLG